MLALVTLSLISFCSAFQAQPRLSDSAVASRCGTVGLQLPSWFPFTKPTDGRAFETELLDAVESTEVLQILDAFKRYPTPTESC